MKTQLIRVLLAVAALSVLYLTFSCDRGPQNANQNQNVGTASGDRDTRLPEAEDPCNEGNLGNKLKKLERAVKTKIANDIEGPNDDRLGAQYIKEHFYLRPVVQDGYVILYVEGAVQGEMKFKKLAEFIESFVKKNCRIRVVYGAEPPEGETKRTDALAGFEWCEYPLKACPGGECREDCGLIPIDKGNSNANANANANSNANANANANANRP